MSDDSVGNILSEIGGLIVRDVRTDPEGAFMYAEAARNVAGASIFKEMEDRVLYREVSNDLFQKIHELWNAAAADKKWNALYYTITGGQFDARFQYEEGWNPEEHEVDRRPRVLKDKYGDKPIDFSDP